LALGHPCGCKLDICCEFFRALDFDTNESSGVKAARHGMTSPGHRHFAAERQKKHAYSKDLEKSEAQFALRLTPAAARRFRRFIPLAD
jgi:hypothetical protein